jgi:hypothetical protein
MAMGHHESEETYLAIGHFIFEFSQLEFALRHFIGEVSGIREEFAEAVISHDFAMLCSIAGTVLTDKRDAAVQTALAGILSDCRRLNDVRVRVAHGLWVPFRGGGTVHHLSRQTLKRVMNADQAHQLEKYAVETNNLRGKLEKLMYGGL